MYCKHVGYFRKASAGYGSGVWILFVFQALGWGGIGRKEKGNVVTWPSVLVFPLLLSFSFLHWAKRTLGNEHELGLGLGLKRMPTTGVRRKDPT
ncbi:hypothetical protein B0H63DRAFT_273909 [Podospora didyma]|uniref:Uncharacterized protein n=1 Tax=Podospora didyma TaxID=330526 RepID=A0AAE0KFJ0_9PEZI|nr:hypothetical protein B0H63DRAFT_273909 [Podospora didyma]